MKNGRYLRAPLTLLLSLLLATSVARAEAPGTHKIDGVPRIKQMTNYCGPACVAAVLQSYGMKTGQEDVGRAVYDAGSGATNGADMLLYARDNGFAAYSWNSTIDDVKLKIAADIPVIVLQQNSMKDTSGHYRVLTGFDDTRGEFSVMDPYYDDITSLTYEQCEALWKRMGHWALLIVPKDKDRFQRELNDTNPVVHMDLAYAQYKRKDYESALKEANTALALEPRNSFALSMQDKISRALGAGAK